MKTIRLSWHSTEYYSENFSVPDDFDHTSDDELTQLISSRATYNWISADGAEIDAVTVETTSP
ncbi:hypothetical protein ACWIGW_44710 [Nocardia brasiliensis]